MSAGPHQQKVAGQLTPLGAMLRCGQAALTGRDSFVMGPSGFGFLHPGHHRGGQPACCPSS